MSASPAFQFYPNDFLGSPAVQAMTAEQIGIYLILLCLDWNSDGFVLDEKKLGRSCKVGEKKFRKAWSDIGGCFALGDDGRYRNARLQHERAKQLAYSERMAENGRKGGRPKAAVKPKLSPEKAAVKPIESIPSPIPLPTTTTTKTTTAKNPTSPKATALSWLGVVAVAFEAVKGAGTFPHAKAGKLLKPLRDAGHSGEEIALRLTRYLARLDDPKFLSFQRFRETFGDYAEAHPDKLRAMGGYPDIVDDFGCFTEYGEFVTRPAGLKLA